MKITFEDITNKRAILMGIATILIVFFHTSISFSCLTDWLNTPVFSNVLNQLKSIANFGVDLFLILSGFGLYYSFSKDENIGSFYKKRLLRILPEYFLVALIFYAFTSSNVAQYFYSVFFLGLFIDANPNLWFISIILILYLLYPLIYKVSKRNGWIAALAAFVLGVFLYFVVFKDYPDVALRLRLFIFRVPVFILGSYFGYLSKNGYEFSRTKSAVAFVISCIVFLVIFVLSAAGIFSNFDHLIFTPIYALSFLFIFMFLSSKDVKESKILPLIGKYSLESYILFEGILFGVEYVLPQLDPFNFLRNFIAVILLIIPTVLLKEFGNLIVKLFKKYEKQ